MAEVVEVDVADIKFVSAVISEGGDVSWLDACMPALHGDDMIHMAISTQDTNQFTSQHRRDRLLYIRKPGKDDHLLCINVGALEEQVPGIAEWDARQIAKFVVAMQP